LSLGALRGKVVLLDFWTFCCINCHHILPQLKKLEERFPRELVVVGVHSAKFPAEGDTFNLRAAVMRYDILHPVVNDREFILWRAYAARAWPTIVIIDPEGRIVGVHAGEFDAAILGDLIRRIIRQFDAEGKLNRTPLRTALEKWKQLDTLLSFPGKLLADPARGRLYVSDTSHHRVLEFDLRTGFLRASYGRGEPGLLDGTAAAARFNAPQGLAVDGERLYVADTENHALRLIDLSSGRVTTLAGTGQQAWEPLRPRFRPRMPGDRPDPSTARSLPARATPLNSPWDVLVHQGVVYIAMAGAHQLWSFDPRAGRLDLVAGDGRETLLDGPRHLARLAQPSGLGTDGDRLWFADSETSSLRSLPVPGPDSQGQEEVRTHVGQGLFDFGDVDGDRTTARMQHNLQVACSDGLVYVADSYNHKVKAYDPHTDRLETLAGTGEPGSEDGPPARASFWEPGGLSVAGQLLYVADTNNHAVRTIDRYTGLVRGFPLQG
jgi:thiol-disulfide isomerase/thioredoxin